MMDSLREAFARLRSFFRKQQMDADLKAELSSHIELAVEENMRRGMTAEEARRNALVSLGGMEAAKELHRDSRGLPAMESILQDIRYTFRTLGRDANFTIFAILILGLGIGASSTVLSLVPYSHPRFH